MNKLFERIFVESLKDDMDQYEKDARGFEGKSRRLDYVGYNTFRTNAYLGGSSIYLGEYEIFVSLSFEYAPRNPIKRTIHDTFYGFWVKGETPFSDDGYKKTCRDNTCSFDSFTEDVLLEHLNYAYGDIKKEVEPYLSEAMEKIENMAKKRWDMWLYKLQVYPKRFDNINNIIKKKQKDFDDRLINLKNRYLEENPFAVGAKIRDEHDSYAFWIIDDIDEENDIIYLKAPEKGVQRWVYLGEHERMPRVGTVFEDGQKVIKTQKANSFDDACYLLRAEPDTVIKRKLSDIKKDYLESPTNFSLKKVSR
jgi:hypothetical protein